MTPALRRANRALERIAEWFALVGGLVVVVLMAMVALDALGRKTFGALPGAFEFSEALMVPAVFLPLMLVQLKREHVFVSAVTVGLPVRAQAFLDGLAAVVGVLIFVFLTWLAVVKALDALAVREYRVAIISVPIWPFRWIIPLGTVLLIVQLAVTAVEEFSRAFGAEEPVAEASAGLPPHG